MDCEQDLCADDFMRLIVSIQLCGMYNPKLEVEGIVFFVNTIGSRVHCKHPDM